jgi:DNA-binding transcriptional regulator GbsR (MarR family)
MGGEHKASEDARTRLIEWLADVGPRWGVPADACRVHGHLYLTATPASADELARSVGLGEEAVGEALAWLAGHDLVEKVQPSRWRTGLDPWELVTSSLEQRRARELGPALEVLRTSRRQAAGDPLLERQIGRLLDLVEDIAAIDRQARRLSPATLRTLLGVGGRISRFMGGGGR